MKTVTINKIKVRIFEEKELREKLNMKEEDIDIVLEYQRTFPELLQEGVDGFVIDTKKLHKSLGVGRDYSTWIKGRINKYNFKESVDYDKKWYKNNIKFDDTKTGDVKLDINNSNQMVRNGYELKYFVTLNRAKELCMIENNEIANIVRKYFITLESTLRNYEEWNKVREPEKQNANILKSKIGEYASRNLDCYDLGGLCSREFNLINKSLTGCTALEIKLKLGYLDKMTREHLSVEYNKAISYLQLFDINLLQCNIDFENRSKMINNICELNYKHLKEEFNK